MASVFTRIIEGELPGRFVWREPACVGLLSIEPLRPGHTLVVPRAEVDHWLDLEPATARRLFEVAAIIGRAQMLAFRPSRVALLIAGFEVPHCHLHVSPASAMSEIHFGNVDRHPDPAALDDAAERLRAALRELGETPAE